MGQSIGLTQPEVVIATNLTPSDTLVLVKRKVLAFCTATGSATKNVDELDTPHHIKLSEV
jgi:phosphoenolpyruvate-protein kinase (PTS system EI component)